MDPFAQVVPFGKYRGQEFPALLADHEYVQWLLSQSLTEPHTRAALERMAERFLSGVLAASTLTTLASALLVAG